MRQRSSWRVIALAVFALLVLVAAGCGDDDDDEGNGDGAQQAEVEQFPADTTMGRIQREGEIVIGVKFDVPPFGFRNPQSGDVEGFDIDRGREIAEALGVEPRFIEAISDNRIPFLRDGTADLILSTMTITAERDEEIDFSEPYYIARGRILVREGSDIQGVDDLAGNSVCTALGSTYDETLQEQAPDADRRLVDSYSECLELIQNEAVDAVSTDDVILTGMIVQDDTLQLVGDELTTEPYGAGLTEGDTAFKEFVDGVLAESKQDGRWAESYEEWVGQYTGEEQEPPTMSLEEALELTE
ncbi:MAG: glutamate ABC transporter substrate-binding protein [Thermoleophilaceae bacterium]